MATKKHTKVSVVIGEINKKAKPQEVFSFAFDGIVPVKKLRRVIEQAIMDFKSQL